MIRSTLAVLAGIAALTITSFAIEAAANPLLMRMFPQALPSEAAVVHNVPATLFLFAYSAACIVFGGYVTAWVAQRAQVLHAVIMGAIQVALTVMAMMSFKDEFPLRNWVVPMALTLPAA